LSDLAEILQNYTYEGPRKTPSVNLEIGSKIPPPGGVLSNSVLGADQDIFNKFGVCVENGAPQRVEWFMYACLEYLRWQMAAILN